MHRTVVIIGFKIDYLRTQVQQLSVSYPKVIEGIEQTPSRLIAELEVN